MASTDEVTQRMWDRAARHPTKLLCLSLETLDAKRNLDSAERLARAVLIDVLCQRHPEADEAFTAWADSDDTSNSHAVAAITSAARKAARKAA